MSYKESELVLKVSKNVNPKNWDEGFYQTFLDLIFKNRTYQKEATEITLRFMNSGEYNCVSDLAKENFEKNEVIRTRFNNNFDAFKNDLDLPNKLSATLDLATGTGKSYVMIAIALIMLASKKVTRVLVLVPSLTIESELTNKFKDILSDEQLIKTLGSDFKTPELLNGDSTIVENSIAIENRDAIYKAQMDKNSITDSLSGHGETTLVLNDEAHHVYYSDNNEWKKFITDKNDYGIDFKYIVGLTGTPYKSRTKNGSSNEYLSDVIYRYSLRDAIEQGFVKDVEYISKEDMPRDKNDRWQVILNSHDSIAKKLENTLGEKPITIVITNTTAKSDSQAKAFKQFLKKSRNLSDNEIDNIVLSVHSKPSAASDRLKLKKVDQHNNPVEFIFSVAMLTEGWDVKRVFQIVPDEEKAFNSKLLIAQVLGRGLRVPNQWNSQWGIPTVTVFNHEKWAINVKSLVEDILEIRKTITTRVDPDSDFNFSMINIKYKSEPKITETMKMGSYSIWENGVKLPTDSKIGKSTIETTNINQGAYKTSEIEYIHEITEVQDLAELLYNRFDDLEDSDFTSEYKNSWPVYRIQKMIEKSLSDSGNEYITKKIKNAFLSSMNTIFRDGSKSVTYTTVPDDFFDVYTNSISNETSDLSSFHKNRTLFYSSDFESKILDDASLASFKELKDTSQGYKHIVVENKYNFKSPQLAISVVGNPEMEFMRHLIQPDVSNSIDAFIKSPDMNFYSFDYVWQKGSHQKDGSFNPDWFIKKGNLYIVVETKDDSQIFDPDTENIGKNKAALEHFKMLNHHLKESGSDVRYKFTFLTPKNYSVFFEKLKNNNISKFASELDVELDKNR